MYIVYVYVPKTHLSQDIDKEDIQLRGFQNPMRVDRKRHGGGVAIFTKPNIYIYIYMWKAGISH